MMETLKWADGARLRLLVLLVAIVTGANGGYTVQKSMNQCAGYCKGTSKFNYELDTVYHYDYEIDVSSAIEGAVGPGDEPSQMMIRAKAVIAALDSPCDLTLTLKDVTVLDPDGLGTYGDTEEFSSALQKNPLRFSLQHGRVEELCSLPGESTWVLNFKRGLLSSIQNSMDDLKVSQTVYETDIAGSCETRYTAFADMWWEEELWGGGGRGRRGKGKTPMTTIRRSKDLASCSERTSYFLSLQSHPTGRSKARHMLRSTHECEQSVSEEADNDIRHHSRSSEEEDEEEFTVTKVGGILLRSECREKHLFEPFSYHGSGATTNVTTRLILKSKEPAPQSNNKASQATARGISNKGAVVPYTHSTLLYDHSADEFMGTSRDEISGEEAVNEVVKALEAVEAATSNGVTGDAPTSFAALIAALRRLSHEDLMALFKVAARGRSRKFLLDAMPVVATAASMSAFRDLYRSGEVSDSEMDSWMSGVAFLKRPTLPMIEAVTPLLEGDPRPSSVLGVTALVHSYCRYGGGDSVLPATILSSNSNSSSEESDSSSSEEDNSSFVKETSSMPENGCREKPEVKAVITRMEDILGKDGCRFEDRDRTRNPRTAEAYLALKGLGNMGVPPSSSAVDSIIKCYKDMESPTDLRLAAVNVLRRVPCSSSLLLRAQLLDTYANISAGPKETEVRIASYVTTMNCPSIEVFKRIKETLNNEQVKQVGSFVWTHLTNLRSNPSTASKPYSGALSDLLASKTLNRKFRADARRFSRHYRISTGDALEPPGAGDWHSAFGGGGISALGAGADAEASVVLSPESYIPRSGALNLTVRLFGAEVDLLDIGARAEGLEPLVESIFGPSGGPSGSSSDDSVVSRKPRRKVTDQEPMGLADPFLRPRSMDRQQPIEPKGSGYVRVFGNELYFGRFKGLGEMLSSVTSRVGSVDAATGRMRGMFSDPIAQLAVVLAHQREFEFSRSVAFLDAALIMPTAAGLPLTLAVNGTASVALSLRGRMDITGRAEGNFEAEGVLAPSAAVMVTGTMAVAASNVARSGLRLDASLQTNTRAEGKLRYRRGKLAEASFTAPRNAGEEVIAVRSKLFSLGRQAGLMKPLTGRLEGREEAESCTPKPVSNAVGSEICAKASYPNATGDDTAPRFPLTGPALVSVTLKKTDNFERYEMKYEYTDEAREEERGEGRGPITDDEYLEEMRTGGKRFKRVRNLLLYFDTPGSVANRKIRGALMIEGGVSGASLIQASVETPWTQKLEVVAGLENTASARGVGLTATLGGEEVVTAQAELRSVLRRTGSESVGAAITPSGRYEPSVSVSVRGRTLIDLHGRVDYVQGSKYSGDLLLAGDLIRDPVTISGDLTNDEGRYDLTGSVKSALIEGNVQGNFKRMVGGPSKKDAGKFVNAKATFKYSIRGGEEQTFDVSARYLRNAKGALAKDSAYFTLLSTQFPNYEVDATWDSSISEGPYFEGRGRLTIGKDGPRWETRPLLVLRGLDHLAFRFFLACRSKKLHYDISLKHQITDKALMQHAILRMGTHHELSAMLNATVRSHPTARYTLDSEIRLPRSFQLGQKSHSPGQRVLALRASVDELRRKNYELYGGVEWWWSSITGAARALGSYSDLGNRTMSDRRLKGKLFIVHGREEIDTNVEEPSLDFSVRMTQADKKANLYASTEKPRKYKMEARYAKTGPGEHTVDGWAELSMGKKYDGKAVVSDGYGTKSLYLELGLGRRMTMDTKLHLGEELNGVEFDLSWDKAANLRLSTGATVEFLGVSSKTRKRNHGERVPELANHGLLGSAWLEYPGRTIRGQGLIMPDEVTADLSWAPDRAIALALHTQRKEGGANFNLSLQTPWHGIERQSASAVYTWDGKRFHGQLDANWRKEAQNLAAELTMVLPKDGASPWESNADLELHIVSTMESIRDTRLSITHRTSPSPLGTNTTVQVSWNGAEALFTNVAWTLMETEQESILTGGAAIRSAGQYLRSFGTEFTFGLHGDREADMKASLSWKRPFDSRRRTVDLGFNLSGLKSGDGYFNITAPLGEYENAKAVFSFVSGETGGHSVMSSELYLDEERAAMATVSGIFTASGVANADAHLEAPWFSAIETSLRHNFRDGEGLSEYFVVKYGGDVVAEADVEASLRSRNDFVVKVSGGISGTFGSAKLEHKLIPSSVRSMIEVTFGGETSSILVDARDEEGLSPRGQTWRPRTLQGSITVTSPRLRSGRLRFAVDFARSGKGNFQTSVSAPGISCHHSLNVKDLLNWESRLEGFRGWEGHIQLPVVNITLINNFDKYSFNHYSHTYIRGFEEAILFTLDATWGGENHPPDIALIGKASLNLPWTYPMSLNLEIPKSSTTESGVTAIEVKTIITYGEDQNNLSITSRMERGGPLTSITSEITMRDCKTMSFGIRYNFAAEEKTILLFASMDNDEQAETVLTFRFPSALGAVARLKISPAGIKESTVASLDFDLLGSEKSFKLMFGTEVDGQIISSQLDIGATLRLDSGKYLASTVVEAPIRAYFSADLDLTKPTKVAIITIKRNGSNYLVLSGSYKLERKSSKLSILLESAMEGMEKVSFIGTYDDIDGDHHLEAVLERNAIKSTFTGKLSMDETVTELQAVVRLPMVGYEYMKADAIFSNTPGPSFTLEYRRVAAVYKINGNALGGEGFFNVSVNVNTPFKGYESMEARVSYAADTKMRKSDISLLLSINQATASLAGSLVSPTTSSMHGNLLVLTPLRGFEKVDVSLYYDASKRGQLDAKAHLITLGGTSTVIFSGKIDEQMNSYEGRILISSPYLPKSIGTFGLEADYQAKRKAEVRVNIGNQIPAYTASIVAIEDGATAIITTPMRGYKKLSVTLIKDLINKTSATLFLTKEEEKYKLQGNIEHGANHSAKLSILVETPISGWEDILLVTGYDFPPGKEMKLGFEAQRNRESNFISAKITGKLTRRAGRASAITRWKFGSEESSEFSIDGIYDTAATEKSLDVNVKTPFEGYEILEAKARMERGNAFALFKMPTVSYLAKGRRDGDKSGNFGIYKSGNNIFFVSASLDRGREIKFNADVNSSLPGYYGKISTDVQWQRQVGRGFAITAAGKLTIEGFSIEKISSVDIEISTHKPEGGSMIKVDISTPLVAILDPFYLSLDYNGNNTLEAKAQTVFEGFEDLEGSAKWSSGDLHTVTIFARRGEEEYISYNEMEKTAGLLRITTNLTTPIEGFEELGSNTRFFYREENENTWDLEVAVTTLVYDEVMLGVEGYVRAKEKSTDMELILNTINPGYETITSNFGYDFVGYSDEGKYIKANSIAEGRTIFSGVGTQKGDTMKVKLNAPFISPKEFEATSIFNDWRKSETQIRAGKQEGTLKFDMSANDNGRIMFTSNVEGYDLIELTWKHEDLSKGINKFDASVTIGKDTSGQFILKKNPYLTDLETRVSVIVPGGKNHNVGMKWDIIPDQKKFHGQMDMAWADLGKLLTVEINAEAPKGVFSAKARGTSSQWRDGQEVTLSVALEYEEIGAKAESYLIWGDTPKDMVGLKGKLEVGSFKALSNLELTAPFTKPISVNLDFDFSGNSPKSLAASYHYGQVSYSFKGEVTKDGFDFELKTPIPEYRTLKIIGKKVVQNSQKEVSLIYELGEGSKGDMRASIASQPEQPFEIKILANIYGSHKYSVKGKLTTMDPMHAAGNMEVKWGDDSSLSLKMEWNPMEKVAMEVDHSGWVAPIIVSWSLKENRRDMNLEVILQTGVTTLRQIRLVADITPEDSGQIRFQTELETPGGNGKWAARGTVSKMEDSSFFIRANLLRDGVSMADVEGAMQRQPGIIAKVSLKGGPALFEAGYDLREEQKEAHILAIYGEQHKIEAKANGILDSSAARGSLNVKTNYMGFKKLNVELELGGKDDERDASIKAEWDNGKVEITASGMYTETQGIAQGRFALRTPWKPLERVELEATAHIKGPHYDVNATVNAGEDYSASIDGMIDFHMYEGELNAMISTSKVETPARFHASAVIRPKELLKIKIETPFLVTVDVSSRRVQDAYDVTSDAAWGEGQKMTLKGKIRSLPEDYGFTGEMEWNGRKMVINAFSKGGSRSPDNCTIDGGFSLTTSYQQFPHMSMFFSLVKEESKLLVGKLNMTTPFEALPTLSATLSLMMESGRGLEGELTATADKRYIRIGTKIQKDLLGRNTVSLDIDLPLLGKSTPLAFECALNCAQPDWTNVAADIKLSLSNSTYGVGMAYEFSQYRVNGSFGVISPRFNYRGGLSGLYENNSLDATGYFQQNKAQLYYCLDNTEKMIVGNISLSAPGLEIPDAEVTIKTSFLNNIVLYSTYNLWNVAGVVDIAYSGQGITAKLLIPPMFDSTIFFKFLLAKETRQYTVDTAISFEKSSHQLQLSIDIYENVIVTGRLESTSLGDRNIDIYLRKDRKIGKAIVSRLIGVNWDASKQSTVSFGCIWKETQHNGKFELKTVGRYSTNIELSSPWLPTGGVNASAFYSNDIEGLKAEAKCETKKGINSVLLEIDEIEGKKALRGRLIQYSIVLAEVDASILLGEGILDGSFRVQYRNSSHRAVISLKAIPLSIEIDLDSELLKRGSQNPLYISSSIDVDERKGHLFVKTPYSLLDSGNFTASAKFSSNGHMMIETRASVRSDLNNSPVNYLAVSTLKFPYPYTITSSRKQYLFELTMSPGSKSFIGAFDYDLQESYGHVNTHLLLNIDGVPWRDSPYYEIIFNGKANTAEKSAETSGIILWAGRKYGEIVIEYGANKFEDGFAISGQAVVLGDEKYQVFMDIGGINGKVELGWPQNESITIDYEREFEGWDAFRVGLSIKTPYDMLEDVSLKLKSVLNDEGYKGEANVRRRDQGIAVKVDGVFANDGSNIILEGGLVVHVNGELWGDLSGHGRFLCSGISLGLDIKSIWSDFRDVHFLGGADWSLTKGPAIKLEVCYNDQEFIAIAADVSQKSLSGGGHLRTLWTHPASMRYELEFMSMKEMSGESRVCYGHCVGTTFRLNGTKEITTRLELPSRVVGMDWALKSEEGILHCSTRLIWDRKRSLGFNFNLMSAEEIRMVLEIDLPVRSFKISAQNEVNGTNNASYSTVQFFWDAARDTTKVLSFGLTIERDKEHGNVEAEISLTHPALRRDVILRLTCSALQLPFWGRLELEYSPKQSDLFIARVNLEKIEEVDGRAKKISLVVAMNHQSSGLNVRIGAQGSTGSDKAEGHLGAKYVDTRGRERTIVLTAKANRVRRSLQLKADTNENLLSVTAGLEDIGLRLKTKVNRKPPLTLRLLLDREMPAASFEADHGRRRYKIYLGSTEQAGYGPIKSVTARLSRRDVDDDAPPSVIAVAPSVETVLSGTTVSLNTSRVLSTRFLWEQRGGLRTPDVPATLTAAFGTMGGWIRDAYSDVGHAWAAVGGEAAAGFLGEGTTRKLRFWYLSIEDEVEGFSTYSRNEVNALVDDFRSLEELLTEMYSRNDFFIQDIDNFIISAMKRASVATSCVSRFLKDAVMEAYVILRKATSAILSSASSLVGDAIEVTGSAVSSALPDPAEAARRLGEATGRVAATARKVGAAVRGAARRLSIWAEGVVEDVIAWVEMKWTNTKQAVWDWAAVEAERMRPIFLIFHSYIIRFKEIVEEVQLMADTISISIAENLANVREIMELGEMVDYYTFKVRNLNWDDVSANFKEKVKRLWETLKEDFRNGLGEYRQAVMEKYTELVGRYDQFMRLPPVVEFTGTVKFIYRKAIWTYHYLEVGDYLKRVITDFVMDIAKALFDLAGQITEASRDPTMGSDGSRDLGGDAHIRGTDRSYVLEAGYFEYNIKLPFDWDSFDSVPHFRQMWERPKETGRTHRVEDLPSGPNRPGSTAFTRIRTALADALLDASSAAAITEATDGEISATAALAALALPPFPASALIAGDSHMVTFDGRDYSFSAAGCTYLLAGDLDGGMFSLLANYDDKGRRRSVTVLLPPDNPSSSSVQRRGRSEKGEKRRIDVAADGRISVDGRRVELPIEVGSATVGREGERVVVEVGRPSSGGLPRVTPAIDALHSSSSSMVLDCNPFHNVCTVRISGWFFSRTAGLLGTYDNEPSDDFETPDGRMLTSGQEAEFAESWRVGNCSEDGISIGGTVRKTVVPSKPSPSPLPTAAEPCKALFDRESDILSPLQPCFSRVDPAPYGRLCEVDVAAASNSPSGWETAACASAAAYVAQCRNAGMDLWVPQSCVRCYLSDGSVLSAGETKVYGGEGIEGALPAPLSGDVVFLVEQRPCLRGAQISNLATKLDNAMRARGLRDNRFALVGFNGGYRSTGRNKGRSGGMMASRVFGGPHTHTADGKIWSPKRNFEKAFLNMQFDGREGNGPGGRTTPMEALWYAARLPFRDGVSKTIILIMCGDCRDATDAAYADAVGMLIEGDLTLHVLAPTVLRTRRQSNTGPSVAVGFDSVGAFTTRNVRILAPNRDLMRQLAIPKDLCSPLALETNGTRFDVGTILGGSPSPTQPPPPGEQASAKAFDAEEHRRKKQRKYALDVFVRRVALTSSPSRCQKCDCVADREGIGRVACQRCLFPSMEQFFKEWDTLIYEDYEQDEPESDKSMMLG